MTRVIDVFYGRTPEILVADDTVDSLQFISEALSDQGYEVRSVTNGTLALSSVRAAKPDLILLDIRMPDMSGYDICKALKQEAETCDIPVIFLSALSESFDKLKAFASGGADYITKPFHLEEVLARIQSQLAWRFSVEHITTLNDQLKQQIQARTAQLAELAQANQQLQQEISARQQVEHALRESETKFRQISEHIQEVFWLADYDVQSRKITQFEYVSPAFELIWGSAWADLSQDTRVWFAGIHGEDQQSVKAALEADAATGDFDREYRVVHPGGKVFWIHDRAFPIQNERGEVYRIVGLAENITEQKHLRDELARSNQELQHFASIASHDLRAPLRRVASFMQLLENRYAEQLDDRARQYIQGASNNVTRMDRLISGLLAYARVSTQGQSFEPIDCQGLVETVLDTLEPTIQETQADIMVQALPTVLGDEAQLGSLFQNLISNALKFCKTPQPRIQITAAGEEGFWRFAVQDNGIGIDPSHSDRIFQLFQRVHAQSEYPGSGIGLSVCRRMVERHGGKLWFESQLGKGTTFYFTLPAVTRNPLG